MSRPRMRTAQNGAAGQIIGWLAEHATTRVGPRGRRSPSRSSAFEAVTVRHYTSRAGDPHRHLHLQVNARVFAAGKWRGLDTVAFRDSIAALNGVGHAAVACDPGFRTALTRRTATRSTRRPRSSSSPRSSAVLQARRPDLRSAGPVRSALANRASRCRARAAATARVGRAGVGEDRPDKVVPARVRSCGKGGWPSSRKLGYRIATRRSSSRCMCRVRWTGRLAADEVAHSVGCCAVGVERRRRTWPGRTTAGPRRIVAEPRCGSSWPKTSPPAP